MSLTIDLSGQHAVVTGASRGIGRAIARTLAAAGAHVTILDRSDALRTDGNSTSDVIRSAGGSAESRQLDISCSAEVDRVLDELAATRGIDILVNNAGTLVAGSATETSDDTWRSIFSVNVDGTFYCSRAALRHMTTQGRGKIVNVTSVSGVKASQGFAAYCAAKGALISLSRQLGIDYAAQGINVNAIAPGFTDTEMTSLYDHAVRRALERQTPNGRWATPQHIADVAAFLVSPLSAHMCGEVVTVDGGWSFGTPLILDHE
ncbi:SDR family NAD(P)-dependent oxidoreductase [Gordonia sp. C13]|uniref:SDR family NAD(P)-dependent oxidoreductase n=1 Tax=Gordonia sp. C13 TaxID=2935078 RepID=UPI00200B7EDA|nr:SDR family NAD(P)-dependent oxidoreductase [Gordonia sp. C13]